MYRTSKEENEILTQTGRGTPMGEFLRRYWWPIGILRASQNQADVYTRVRRRSGLVP